MRIGITGTQSVGKTTLLQALNELEVFKGYAVCDEVTRWVKSLGISINEDGTDTTQELVMMKHIYNVFMFNDMVTDRTALDGLVYTQWMYNKGKVTVDTLNAVQAVFDKLIDSYDHIFFIKPEFDVVDDGVRSADVVFRDEIHDLFVEKIKSHNIKVKTISGTVDNRVSQVLKGIKDE